MNRRYQVFVSSTYTDLVEERAEVMQALLELDCNPAGMELFPAASEEQWEWIKRVIDESDYYVVIVGGRYGSTSERTGISYTEMEYRYALETGKPTIAFLHEKPTLIESGKTEAASAKRRKLEQFRSLLEQKLCKYWLSPADLGAKVSRGVTQLIKHHPAVGWIRADEVPEDQTKELLALRRQVEELTERLKLAGLGGDNTALARGRDKYIVQFRAELKYQKQTSNGRNYWAKEKDIDGESKVTWDEIFLAFAGNMHTSVSEYHLLGRMNRLLENATDAAMKRKYPGKRVSEIRVLTESWDTIKLQLRALGLIAPDTQNNWQLTEEGERYLIQLKAVHRAPAT